MDNKIQEILSTSRSSKTIKSQIVNEFEIAKKLSKKRMIIEKNQFNSKREVSKLVLF